MTFFEKITAVPSTTKRMNVNGDQEFPRVSSQVPLSPKNGDEDAESEEGEEFERGNWTGRFDFILSLLGYSVGLGNVWRFPYLCYQNGGGAFLIPFVAMMLLAGLPLLFMELAFGQYASMGPVIIFDRFCPLFRGLGYGMIVVSGVVMLYYNVIIAWTLFYMAVSLTPHLPWADCAPEWSTESCYSYQAADNCRTLNGTYHNRTCHIPSSHPLTSMVVDHVSKAATTALNLTASSFGNQTTTATAAGAFTNNGSFTSISSTINPLTTNPTPHPTHLRDKTTPAEEYFQHYVLTQSDGIEHTGEVNPWLAVSLFVAWLIVFLCLSKGVQSSGKVVYFTALFPYVVLVILFFRGITLPGAYDGIMFYVKPDWGRLVKAQVWGDAAVQIFFALSPAWGGLITLASYNKFHNNCYQDALIVSVSNILTSIFAGFVIFSIIGYLAHELEKPVSEVIAQGSGLAFIAYPEVVARLPFAPVWSFLFFFMLLTLGLDSQFALLETVQTALLDRFPRLRDYKIYTLMIVSIFGFSGGLIFVTRGGVFWLELFDHYAANFSVLIIAISECLIISRFYGADRFLRDVEKMIGSQSYYWTAFWSFMWRYATPATLIFILIFNWLEYEPAHRGDYIFPGWANGIGWFVAFLPVILVLVMMIEQYIYCEYQGSFKEKILMLMEPKDEWGHRHKTALELDDDIDAIMEDGITVALRGAAGRDDQSGNNDSDDSDQANDMTHLRSFETSFKSKDHSGRGGGGGGGSTTSGSGGMIPGRLAAPPNNHIQGRRSPGGGQKKLAKNGDARENSFDNPSYNVEYTFETQI